MPVIEVANLRKAYGETVAVDDVSFTVDEGEIFGIVGRNGAGKTTAVECVAGLRTPDAGSITVAGLDPRADRDRLRRVLGVQLQECRLPEKLRVGEAMWLYRSFYPDGADPGTLLAGLGLDGMRDTAFEDLSGGQQQRLSIALALVGDPRIAVLDELTTGLDPQSRRETWRLIENVRASGVTVVLVSHFMDEVERLCDRLAVLDRGRLVALDTPAGLVERVGGEQRITFRCAQELDEPALRALPEVDSASSDGRQWTIIGSGNLLYAVSAELARQRITPAGFRAEQASLDDAFLALTGRSLDGDTGVTEVDQRGEVR
ncbi:ABC transporter ATP-binding protein [Haloechinothrix sp. LS1_15]|uniref:ABC transporter ATP-binding protein n=1 Tax=Haloechinothrix sp. LS1_15 TaxID=2652248 RepID=UPI002945F9B3|nr:ABC transporter ATP-binding protein [Haloechinothrix sp. LS1_15]MDV6011605.1 ABC transporter ATP-binding protein [Haloechinothrix sp. LS1_15]